MQSHPPVTMVNQEMADEISLEVETMLEKGAILPIQDPLNKGFYLRIFLVPKKDSQSRLVVNLCPQNGGHPCGEGSPSTRGLDEQNRFKGCTFCHPNTQTIPQIPVAELGVRV